MTDLEYQIHRLKHIKHDLVNNLRAKGVRNIKETDDFGFLVEQIFAIPDKNTLYTLTQDASDGHKITLTPSDGTATTITIPDKDTTYEIATSIANGLMSSSDKEKLDNMYSKEQIDILISRFPKFSITVVDELPTEGISDTTIYLLKNAEVETGDMYTEYIHINGNWEKLGTQKSNLEPISKDEINALFD